MTAAAAAPPSRIVLDVSSYQPASIDFARIRIEHPAVTGVIVKATEGMWEFTNPGFFSQCDSAHAAGLAVGAYCFDHPEFGGVADAQLFLDRIASRHLELGVWLDCEVTDGLPPAVVAQRLAEDANYIADHYPMRAGVYTGPWFWVPETNRMQLQALALWVSGYTPSMPQLPPWQGALMWQFTDQFPTYFGDVDASWFEGTERQWEWLTRTIKPTGVDLMASMPTVDLTKPVNLQAPPLRTAQALLGARGGWIDVNNGNHDGLVAVLGWFQAQAKLPVRPLIDTAVWEAVIKPLPGVGE